MIRIHALLAALMLFCGHCAAQGYPVKPVRIVVPYAAGGATDALARPLAQRLTQVLGQQVIVENRPGADSILGTAYVANAQPDGYTLLLNAASHTLIPFYNKNVTYDPIRDFTPIATTAISQRVIVVHPSLPVNSVKELVDYAKAQPGKIFYAVAAAGSIQELAGDLLKVSAGIDINPISYKGGGPALTDLLGGQVQMAILVLPDTLQYVRTGKLRALGVVESRRSRAAPDIPTVAEAGIAGYAIPDQWVGIMGPAGMAPALVAQINDAVNKVLNSPETRTALERIGYEVIGGSAKELGDRMTSDVQTYRKFADLIGFKPR